MTDQFFRQVFHQQQHQQAVPSNEVITQWAEKLVCVFYPQLSTCVFSTEQAVRDALRVLQEELENILCATTACHDCDNKGTAAAFFKNVPAIYHLINTDIEAIVTGDPAAQSAFEVIRAYPGFYSLSFYRIAHALYRLGVPLVPRILTEQAHSRTGIDIHPAATIGEYCCIDHGTGIVIGETSHIGNHVKLYQGVTLGALSVSKEMAYVKRHPTVEDHVVIYSGATILGGDTVVGHHSVIGGNVWLTESVPPGSVVYHKPEITVMEGKLLKS